MKTWGRLSGKQHSWSLNSAMEVIISLKTLKVSENSWVFSSVLLWSACTSPPQRNMFSSGIVTLANLVGRDPIHSSSGLHFSQSVILKMPSKGKMQYTSPYVALQPILVTLQQVNCFRTCIWEQEEVPLKCYTWLSLRLLFCLSFSSLLAEEWAFILVLISLYSSDHLWHFQGLKLLLSD